MTNDYDRIMQIDSKVIEDMARAMIEATRSGKDDFTDLAEAALATLPEFIVLDEGAEPEVGDIVEINIVCDIKGECTVICDYEDRFAWCDDDEDFEDMFKQVNKRKGVPVLIRKSK